MKFLKRLLRHRYRIDRTVDWRTMQVRYVVREKEWWHVFGPYLSVDSADSMDGAWEIIKKHKKWFPMNGAVAKN